MISEVCSFLACSFLILRLVLLDWCCLQFAVCLVVFVIWYLLIA